MMSAFLSPDNYMQDPTSQQGFNRYAYCMYNPLKYVDPSGENGNEPQGNSSGNHGSPGGSLDGPNNKHTSYFSELKKFVEENTKYFFIDGGEALDFMYENSFDENMNAYKEIAAWVVDEGIIVQPWYNNTERASGNIHTPFDENNNCYYWFQGEKYLIRAEIHTHPNYNNGDIGVSQEDFNLNDNIPVYILYNSSLYRVGKPTIRIDQTRNINYYNWKNYFFKY